jgi:hypothetical protein
MLTQCTCVLEDWLIWQMCVFENRDWSANVRNCRIWPWEERPSYQSSRTECGAGEPIPRRNILLSLSWVEQLSCSRTSRSDQVRFILFSHKFRDRATSQSYYSLQVETEAVQGSAALHGSLRTLISTAVKLFIGLPFSSDEKFTSSHCHFHRSNSGQKLMFSTVFSATPKVYRNSANNFIKIMLFFPPSKRSWTHGYIETHTDSKVIL